MVFWQEKQVIAGCPLTIMLLLILGWRHDLFHTTASYDIFMHFLGGGFFVITLAGAAWHLKWTRGLVRTARPAIFRAGLVAGLILASIAWETAEVAFDMTPNWTQSVADTASDILYALLGSAIALYFIRQPE